MRLYTAADEETLRARSLLKDWADDGLLTKEQYRSLEKETVSDLRTTNIFLRLVFFLFTLIGVGAAAALVVVVVLSRPSDQTIGIFFLIFAAGCYAAAEAAVSQGHLYRYGIEEALAVCSGGFLCAGMQAAFFSGGNYSPKPDLVQSLVPAAGAVLSLWIWQRFGLWYAFIAAMIFAIFLPGYFTSSHSAQRVLIALFYAAGLARVAAIRSRHRSDYLDDAYSFVEACLWVGIYLAFNLKLWSLIPARWWWSVAPTGSEFGRAFYWTTWGLIWCLPPVVLARGLRQKDRFVIAAGAMVAILTMVSNKPYLGWPRHAWDPMLLGILLAGVALFVRRWLELGPGGIRRGFTAARLSGKAQQLMNVGSAVLGLAPTQSVTPSAQANTEFRFGGGSSGGGGASSEF